MPKDLVKLVRNTFTPAESSIIEANYSLYYFGFHGISNRKFLGNCRRVLQSEG